MNLITMRSLLPCSSSSKSSWRLIRSMTPQPSPYSSSSSSSSSLNLEKKPQNTPSLSHLFTDIKTATSSAALGDHEHDYNNLKEPFSKDKILTQTHVVDTLLANRADPTRAHSYFTWAERRRGFMRGVSDPYCVLALILVSSSNREHSVLAQNLLNRYVSSDCSPSGVHLFDQLGNCSERFGFDLSNNNDNAEVLLVFDYLLNSYVRAGRLKDAADCFNAMITRNVIPSVRILNLTLSGLVRRNMIPEALKMYNVVLSTSSSSSSKEGKVYYDSATVHVMMHAYLKEGKVEEAYQCFSQAKASGCLVLDAAVYSTGIRAVCESNHLDIDRAFELLNEMKQMGWIPSEGTFTNVISACVRRKDLVRALKWKDEMIGCGHSMNLIVATNLIKGYCCYSHGRSLNAALDLFNKIVEDGLIPNKVTYAVLIQGCCRHGNMEKAHELYTKMKLAGIQPTTYILNSLIGGFLNAGMLDKANEHFDEGVMASVADVHTYNCLLSWYGKWGKVSEAHAIWGAMVKTGIKPYAVSYNYLILGSCRAGDMDAALGVLSEMLERNVGANVVTYSILIDGYFKKGEKDLALKMFDRMVSCGVVPMDFTYNTIVNGLCKLGKTNEAKSWLDELVEMGFGQLHRAYNSMIDGYVKEGSINSALAIFKEMCQRGIGPNVVTYTSLINGFCKSNNIDLAIKFGTEMKEKGIELDITVYSALLDGFCKKGDMENACNVFNELSEMGLAANTVVYNSMISGYRDIKNIEAALALHRRMISEGIPCDLATYTTLIDALLKDGKLLLASDLYMEMLAKDIVPDAVTHFVLVRGLCNKGQLANARKVLDDMYVKNLTPNVLIYSTLISGYFKQGNLQEAFRLHDEMLERGLTPDDKTYDILVAGKF